MIRNNIEEQYLDLLRDILENGVNKGDRTGTGTISVFGRQIRHDMSLGFPLLTTKKMGFKNIKTELAWFLAGRTDLRFLLENNCHIWVGDAYKNYLTKMDEHFVGGGDLATKELFIELIKTDDEFAKEWGDLGPIYGHQWRHWGPSNVVDGYIPGYTGQIKGVLKTLSENPDSRRIMVNAWNVEDIDKMTLAPCHYGFQVYTTELSKDERYNYWFRNNYETGMERNYDNIPDYDNHYYEKTPTRRISLMWNQRSVDTPLGLPYNIASYALLLHLLASEMNMIPDELIGNLGDTHIYSNQIEGVKKQLERVPMKLPSIEIMDGMYSSLSYDSDDVRLVGYESHPTIKFPLSN
tara:strand:+ start:4404 stop:5456 length:1053 start_codon:yes stop_codon:yes gene_type:complete